ncbi:MAG TPA: 4Fe-4S binding protein [Bacteroidales bacterium]|nr:4Fe-4S binding protein [Bacteroidales bacterium]
MRSNRKRVERYLALVALLTIATAWWAGKEKQADRLSKKMEVFYPASSYQLQSLGENLWKVTSKKQGGTGFLATGSHKGYAGPVRMLVHYNRDLRIEELHVWSQSETPSYFSDVIKEGYLQVFPGKAIDEPFLKITETDGVSGATKTCQAIAHATREASAITARHTGEALNQSASPCPPLIGAREVILLLLFSLGIIIRLPGFQYKKQLQWIMLTGGLLFLGFVYASPLSLTNVNSILVGYWPDWQSELYLYILLAGILIILLTTGRNPYCQHFCPFGAYQQILGSLGKARSLRLKRRYWWTWLQRSLAWLAILIAVFTHNPGISDYVVFGSLFQFTGSHRLFILLGLVTITSLFIKKPWCNFLCPIRPITDYIRLFRLNKALSWKRKTNG